MPQRAILSRATAPTHGHFHTRAHPCTAEGKRRRDTNPYAFTHPKDTSPPTHSPTQPGTHGRTCARMHAHTPHTRTQRDRQTDANKQNQRKTTNQRLPIRRSGIRSRSTLLFRKCFAPPGEELDWSLVDLAGSVSKKPLEDVTAAWPGLSERSASSRPLQTTS